MLPSEMAKNVAKTWAEFELLSENNAVELRMDPTLNEPKKNILSYLLPKPGNGNRKLKVLVSFTKIHRRIRTGAIRMSLAGSILTIHLAIRLKH